MGSFPTRRSSDLINGLGSAQIGAASSTTTGYDGTSASVSGGFTDALNLSGSGTLTGTTRSEEHTSELQTRRDYVCRSLLEKEEFSTFANLQGGSGVDTFALTGAATFNPKVGAGLDVVNLGGFVLSSSIAGTEAYTLSLHDALPIFGAASSTTTGYDGTSASVSGGFTDALNLSGSGTLTGTT